MSSIQLAPQKSEPRRWWIWFWIIALVAIHTADMELTTKYIGDNWSTESFPVMRLTIKHFGIEAACWLSRLVMYSGMYLAVRYGHRWDVYHLLVIVTLLYYAAQVCWLFTLGLLHWPTLR